ncbi:hypothetical protein PR202_gb17482 [Eleusine coracana subsp. coracana]|uniref:F-box associated beta-propeller type 3 domain-containing protein n=1 Tax=Eleusine coracana subsp. coracana TaxID=191504 RepID=A0AAV5F3P4_ELECO|nr:hypothetical protein QOZ80_6BG0465750 [Eleusine coracana subsp. coracana]GJN29272.1 hypothetical protein PR202_gb17482 [Eleusine coracana subsp. coracana]
MSDGIRFAYTFLMFDPAISPHFHLVQVWQGNWIAECVRMDVEGVHCYSSEVRGWSDRSSEWKRGGEGGEWEQWGEALIQHKIGRAFVNGMLHFVVYHLHQQEALIVALDVKGKTCWITRWEEKHKHSGVTFIGQSQGRLHCISMDKELRSYLSVWVLEDYDTEEWILKHRVNCSKLFGKMNCSFFYFSVVAIHPDHNVVFFVQHWNNQKLLSYNMDSRELHGLCSDYESTSSTSYVPYFMESAALANK